MNFAAVALGQQEGSLTNAAAVRMPGVQYTTQHKLPVGTLQLQPENSRNPCNSSIGNAHDHLERAVSLALPHPSGSQAVPQIGTQAFEPTWIHVVVMLQIVGSRPE